MKHTFQHKSFSVNYSTFGSGSKPIIAFHGFTQDSTIFSKFESIIHKDNFIIAIDLFYHGETEIEDITMVSISKNELRTFFDAFFKHLQISSFSVIGYSMGGRVAIFLIDQFPKQIKTAYLLAPDGIETSLWTRFVTNTLAGKMLYNLACNKPKIVFKIASTGVSLKIFPNSIYKFLEINFGSETTRIWVYKIWMFYKFIRFKKSKIAKKINDNRIKTYLIVGHKDPAVQPKSLKKFQKRIKENSELHIIKAGHDLFKEHVLEYLKQNVFFLNKD